jgi:hypothetical protein
MCAFLTQYVVFLFELNDDCEDTAISLKFLVHIVQKHSAQVNCLFLFGLNHGRKLK